MGKETNQNDALAELPVAVTPKTIVIRSLRRRLWQAFQRDDAAAALAIYCATRSDWEGWVQQEKEQEQAALAAAKLQGSGRQPSFLMKKLLKKKKSLKDPPTPATNIPTTALGTPVGTMVGSSSNPLLQSAPTSPSSLESVSCDNNETPNVSLLQLYCDPSESFVLDDYKSLYASYEIENDDDKNAAADTLSQEAVARPASSSRPRRMHKLRMPRQAVGSFWGGQQQRAGSAGAAGVVVAEQLNTDNDASPLTTEQEAAVATSANRIDVISDARMTTPLHEAARCGSGALVRIMLGMQTQHAQQHNNNGNGNSNSNFPNQADPNVRNGALQTALHMVAGGVTDKERIRIDELERQRHYDETDKDDKDEDGESTSSSASQSSSLKHVPIVGLRRPLPIVEEVPVTHNPAAFQAKKAARAVGRFLRVIHNQKDAPPDKQSSGDKKNAAQNTDTTTVGIIISDQEWEQLQRARLDAAMAILSWSRPNNSNDGTDTNYHQYFQGGHGPSTNAVDLVGRTALHYAAELGRSAICMQLFSSFGTMLTIVDDSSRTPCELASCSKYDDLAAQLEARALLYLDPYGVDDELLAAVMADETGYLRNVLAPPFNMFETYSWDDVLRERNRRMDQTLHKMRKIADIREVEERARALMFLEVIDEKTKQSIPRDEVAKRSSELVQKKKALEPTGVKASTTQDLETSLILIAVKVITDEVSVPSAGPKVNDDSEPCLGPNATDDDSVSSPAAKATGEDLEPSPGVKATSEDLVPSPGGKATGEDLVPSPGGKTTGEDSVSSPGGKTTGEDSVSSPGANASEDLEQYSGAKATTDVHLKAADEDFVPSHGVKTTGQDSEPCPAANAIGEADNVASKEDKPREEDDKPREAALVVESLHKSHVELYLTFHVWNVDEALLAFFLGPVAAFLEAGVPLPMGSLGGDELKFRDSWALEHTCLICCDVFEADSSKWKSLQGCEHSFCIDCLGEYISDSAQSKTTGLVIPCPHHECCAPLSPLEVVNLSPDSDVYGRLLDAANENFVTSAEDLRFCPHPGCPGVVKFNLPSYIKAARISSEFLTIAGAVCTAVHGNAAACPPTYEGVYDPNYFSAVSLDQPKRAHRFCFACGDSQVHWPISCKRLDEWKSTVQEEVKDVEDEDGTDYNDVAQRLWLKANTRPCPKCKAPIEKNEGCNHMTCSNPRCKHEFCWICRNDWKLHNTETGGFFRCNRWEDQKDHEYYDEPPPPQTEPSPSQPENVTDPSRMEITYGTAMHATRIAWKRSRDMARFLFHYQRYSAHAESAGLERKMSETSCERLAPVVAAAIEFDASPDFNFGGKGLSFVHSAFIELNECRSVLQHSYVFSFFRYKPVHPRNYKFLKRLVKEKLTFEQIQAELEMMTEQMSNVVARSHLRATQAQITFLTATSADKRKEFSNLMIHILNDEAKEARSDSEAGDGQEQEKSFRDRNRLLLNGTNSRITGLATTARVADTGQSNRETPGEDSEDNEAIEQALRASLEEFMSNTGSRDVLEMDGDISGAQGMDWPCSACTYMNNGGRQCAMCGTQR